MYAVQGPGAPGGGGYGAVGAGAPGTMVGYGVPASTGQYTMPQAASAPVTTNGAPQQYGQVRGVLAFGEQKAVIRVGLVYVVR